MHAACTMRCGHDDSRAVELRCFQSCKFCATRHGGMHDYHHESAGSPTAQAVVLLKRG
jgi:hypothetical protein